MMTYDIRTGRWYPFYIDGTGMKIVDIYAVNTDVQTQNKLGLNAITPAELSAKYPVASGYSKYLIIAAIALGAFGVYKLLR